MVTVHVLVITVLVVTVLIVSNKWVQVLPVQCKMECNVNTLALILAGVVTFHFCIIYLGELVYKCWALDIPLNRMELDQ